MAKRTEGMFGLFVEKPDGTAVRVEDLTPEERADMEKRMSERLSVVMSAYYSKHLDEFIAMKSLG